VKTFHCTVCQALVFFENTKCLNCGHGLAYLPDREEMTALSHEEGRPPRPLGADNVVDESYKLCANYADNDVCNWTIPIDDPDALCRSCRLTHTIPNLAAPANKEAWLKLETAKRRLVYALLRLKLPVNGKKLEPASGLEFRFLSDAPDSFGDRSRVLTGHDNGLITINVAEADDVYRETQRLQHREPYRTLLGHFRHEIGHYYWDRLIAGRYNAGGVSPPLRRRADDYQAALARHYAEGPPANWADSFISAYATTHPWEDWAESWAHVMHMIDAIETAHFVGMSVRPARSDEPELPSRRTPLAPMSATSTI
jgi:hypothetical protein